MSVGKQNTRGNTHHYDLQTRDICAGKHASLGICVWGNTHPGETRIPMTPALHGGTHLDPHNSSNEILFRLSVIENDLRKQENFQKQFEEHFSNMQATLKSISYKLSECCDAIKNRDRLSPFGNSSDIIPSEVSSYRSNIPSISPPAVGISDQHKSPSPSISPLQDTHGTNLLGRESACGICSPTQASEATTKEKSMLALHSRTAPYKVAILC